MFSSVDFQNYYLVHPPLATNVLHFGGRELNIFRMLALKMDTSSILIPSIWTFFVWFCNFFFIKIFSQCLHLTFSPEVVVIINSYCTITYQVLFLLRAATLNDQITFKAMAFWFVQCRPRAFTIINKNKAHFIINSKFRNN